MKEHQRFDGGDALRQAAENRFGRSLTPQEWGIVDPEGWSGRSGAAYDEADLDELLAEMAKLPPPPEPSVRDKKRAQSLASRYRTASEAKEFVERLRLHLFGRPSAPFKDDGAAAAEWVQSQPVSRKTTLFALSVACPTGRDSLDNLIWLRDWLTTTLRTPLPDDRVERRRIIKLLFQSENSRLRSIAYPNTLLDYLAPDESGGIAIRRLPTDDGTILDSLRRAADALAKATLWSPVSAVHHILTGGVTALPVTATCHNRWGREDFGGPAITLQILDPFGVTAEQVAEAYTAARESIIRPGTGPRKRARRSEKSEQLASLVAEAATLTWKELWILWNLRHPTQRFPSPDAMRQAYQRTRRP